MKINIVKWKDEKRTFKGFEIVKAVERNDPKTPGVKTKIVLKGKEYIVMESIVNLDTQEVTINIMPLGEVESDGFYSLRGD